MPYKTRYGSHYHMTEGCHGATIPCDTGGLTPCSDCCGRGEGTGNDKGPGDSAGMVGGSVAMENALHSRGRNPATDGSDMATTKDSPVSDDAMKADAMVETGIGGMRGGMRAPGNLSVTASDMADALARTTPDRPATSRIGEDTDFALRPTTGDGTASSLQDLVSHGHDPKELYAALRGCEWSAEAMADVLNAHDRMLYAHGWKAIRTASRHLAVEGKDAFGNTRVLYANLQGDEPDMCEGPSLQLSLTNRSRVNLAVSNMLSRKCSEARFENVLYDAAGDWRAESFAEAMNEAHRSGVVHDRNWRAVYTRDDKCAIAGRDAFGNEHTLIIRRG